MPGALNKGIGLDYTRCTPASSFGRISCPSRMAIGPMKTAMRTDPPCQLNKNSTLTGRIQRAIRSKELYIDFKIAAAGTKP
ncbi:hypothetical protein Nepgr_023197 [Nepenthes gracilis]|uniref:Uncharacterized protein n=1 Tax=Nepenthes gracilis TaxID=150966 RepID=A0AAD3T205_NEPGR|nr:hypothetical protein Nepgr_023197 [Nepenthes gracilis]